MNLQNIISHRENREEESKTNTLENYMNDNINNNIEGEKELEYDVENRNKNDSSRYSNNDSPKIENEIDNKKENDIVNNIEHNIEIDNINNLDYNNINNDNINQSKENNIITENNLNNKDNINNEKIVEKDIIDELIEKIRNNQDLGLPKDNPKKSFEKLDEELKLGLEQLNQIKTNSNKKTILDTQNELEKKSFERNKKYNEVISELTKTFSKPKNSLPQYKRGTYYNYKNMFILKPSTYFQSERKSKEIYEHPKKKERFYMSSIDGKIITNGERKFLDKNFYKNEKRNYPKDKRDDIGNINNFFPEFRTRKNNYYDKNFFNDELNRINNLFSL